MPAFVLPQFLLCGLLVPRDSMDTALRWVSDVLPLSYAVDAMRSLTTNGEVDPGAWADLSVVVLAILLALGLGAVTLRRRTP
jgi:ABC-2 type transport system permease protein